MFIIPGLNRSYKSLKQPVARQISLSRLHSPAPLHRRSLGSGGCFFQSIEIRRKIDIIGLKRAFKSLKQPRESQPMNEKAPSYGKGDRKILLNESGGRMLKPRNGN